MAAHLVRVGEGMFTITREWIRSVCFKGHTTPYGDSLVCTNDAIQAVGETLTKGWVDRLLGKSITEDQKIRRSGSSAS